VLKGERNKAARAPGAAEIGVLAARAARTEEEEESDGGQAPPERWNPPPPSPRAAVVAMEQAPVAGAEAPTTRTSVEGSASVVEALASTAEVPASAMAAPAGTTAAPPEPSRKRKRGFSNLRSAVLPARALNFKGRCSPSCFLVRRVMLLIPALAPAKALRSGAPVTTRRYSLRAPRATASAVTTGKPPRDTVVATGPQQEGMAAAAAAATAVASVSPSLVPTAGD
jgi:hypothetical protein